jgi:hypothetical protein
MLIDENNMKQRLRNPLWFYEIRPYNQFDDIPHLVNFKLVFLITLIETISFLIFNRLIHFKLQTPNRKVIHFKIAFNT